MSSAAHAFAEAAGSVIVFAFSICAFSFGSLTCAVFTFPVGTMFFPLKSGSIMLWGEKKSAPHPKFGQIATAAFGTSQYFESIVACGTSRSLSLKPSFPTWLWNASAVSFAGGASSANVRSAGPAYFPLAKPAFLMYCCARGTLAVGLDAKSNPGPWTPPPSSNPPIPGGKKWVAIVPIVGPPRVWRKDVLSIAALRARRTLTLSSGLILVLSPM